jgi:hypothetical protein
LDEFSDEIITRDTVADPFMCGPVTFTLYLDDQITEITTGMADYDDYSWLTLDDDPNSNGRDFSLTVDTSDKTLALNTA